jgi:hypothetical protein
MDAHVDDAEIFARFLQEELGWEAFMRNYSDYAGSSESNDLPNDRSVRGIAYVRCAPGRTNPLYPDDPQAGTCAPTIDKFTYETVQIDVAQLGVRGPSGIWVVTGGCSRRSSGWCRPPTLGDGAPGGFLRHAWTARGRAVRRRPPVRSPLCTPRPPGPL